MARTSGPCEARVTRLFRAFLAIYPGEFRDEYGREMALVFADRYRDAKSDWERLRVCGEALAGALKEAPREHAEIIGQDLRQALRTLRRQPGFAATVVLTLGLGIGANTAVFSLVSGVLLRPLPYPDPGRIVTVAESARPNELTTRNLVAPANFLDWRNRSRALEPMGAYATFGYSLSAPGEPERVVGAAMSHAVFRVLGARPMLGREIGGEDDRPAAPRVVLLGARLFGRRFHSDARIVGGAITINGEPHVVIGVMPASFDFPESEVELWTPLERQVTPVDMRWRGSHYLGVVGRLRPEATIDQARAEMNAIAAALKREQPRFTMGEGAVVLPLREDLVRGVRRRLWVLFAAVVVVLMIACTNVANLMLVRAGQRHREIAVRAALGAGRWRIARQLLVESALLSTAGGALGMVMAVLGKDALLALTPQDLPRTSEIHMDGAVLLFTVGVSLTTAVVFGLTPALGAARAHAPDALKAGARSLGLTGGGRRLRAALVVGEVALSLVLLAAAGLLIRSFARLQGVDAGYRAAQVLTARVSLPRVGYSSDAEVVGFYDRLLERVRALPGVEGAAAVTHLPLTGHEFDNSFAIEGRPSRPGQTDFALLRGVSPRYFEVLGIPVWRGRAFTEFDRPQSPSVAMISEAMARRYWPGQDPLGKRITVHMGEAPSPREIVGIVRDVRTEINVDPEPMIYLPYSQQPFRSMALAVRTAGGTAVAARALRQALQDVDPEQPIYQVRTLEELVAETLAPWRFAMVLLTTFAALALLLAALGLFGVMSRLVVERTAEIGVRMALGARRDDILALVLGQSLRLVATGLVIGSAAALAATRALRSMLFQTAPADAATFAAAAVTLATAAALATALPARQAAGVDPLVALRQE